MAYQKKTKVVSCRMTPALHQRVQIAADVAGKTAATFLVEIIEAGVSRYLGSSVPGGAHE